jgi:hypothetical protein
MSRPCLRKPQACPSGADLNTLKNDAVDVAVDQAVDKLGMLWKSQPKPKFVDDFVKANLGKLPLPSTDDVKKKLKAFSFGGMLKSGSSKQGNLKGPEDDLEVLKSDLRRDEDDMLDVLDEPAEKQHSVTLKSYSQVLLCLDDIQERSVYILKQDLPAFLRDDASYRCQLMYSLYNILCYMVGSSDDLNRLYLDLLSPAVIAWMHAKSDADRRTAFDKSISDDLDKLIDAFLKSDKKGKQLLGRIAKAKAEGVNANTSGGAMSTAAKAAKTTIEIVAEVPLLLAFAMSNKFYSAMEDAQLRQKADRLQRAIMHDFEILEGAEYVQTIKQEVHRLESTVDSSMRMRAKFGFSARLADAMQDLEDYQKKLELEVKATAVRKKNRKAELDALLKELLKSN